MNDNTLEQRARSLIGDLRKYGTPECPERWRAKGHLTDMIADELEAALRLSAGADVDADSIKVPAALCGRFAMPEPLKQVVVAGDHGAELREPLEDYYEAAGYSCPEHIRRQVGRLAQWLLRMSHNESYFGEPAGLVKSVTEDLAHAVDPIYPPIEPEPDPLAGVTIYTATVPFAAAPRHEPDDALRGEKT